MADDLAGLVNPTGVNYIAIPSPDTVRILSDCQVQGSIYLNRKPTLASEMFISGPTRRRPLPHTDAVDKCPRAQPAFRGN